MIWTLVAGWIAKRGIMMGVIAAVGAGVLFWDHKRAERHRDEGKREIVDASRKIGKERNAKARKIRENVTNPGSMDRLRRDFCRDC